MSDPVVRGRPEAAAPFVSPPDPAVRAAERASRLRRSGLVRALVAGIFAMILLYFGRVIVGSLAASVGTLTLFLALFSPTKGYAALSRFVDWVGERVGSLLAWVLLAPVFFLFFVPYRLVFRRGRNDALARGFDRGRASYWSAHGAPRDLEKPY